MTGILPTGKCRYCACTGFTLLEMLVAISIGGILMAAAYGTFSAANRTTRTLDRHEAYLQNLSYASAAFKKDVRAALQPPVGESGKNRWQKGECRFTVCSGDIQQGVVRYWLDGESLMRNFEPVESKKKSASGEVLKKKKAPVARDVHSASFSYFAEGSWRDSLRPKQWPEAIRFSLRLGKNDEGRFAFTQVVRLEVR